MAKTVIGYLNEKSDEELCTYYEELFNSEEQIPQDAQVRQLVADLNEQIESGDVLCLRVGLNPRVYVGTIWAEICQVMAYRFCQQRKK